MEKITGGYQLSFASLLDANKSSLFRFVHGFTHSKEEAEEIVRIAKQTSKENLTESLTHVRTFLMRNSFLTLWYFYSVFNVFLEILIFPVRLIATIVSDYNFIFFRLQL